MKEHQELIDSTREHVKKLIVDKNPSSAADTDYLKKIIRDNTGAFLFKKTERRPMILPIVIEV
jgi:mRNA degradation ribonuclease J1/J2